MADSWSRRQIEERVDVLRERYEGEEFAAAVERFGREELDAAGRGELGEILLERAGEHARSNPALRRRMDEGGWLRRTFRRLDQRADD
jgi:hypothetical protein